VPRRYAIDIDAVAEAEALLGLRSPVRVFIRRYEWLDGRYIALRDGVHHVGVAHDLSARAASKTVWHELTHALQAERLGGERAFRQQWWAEMRAAGVSRPKALRGEGRAYRRTALEVEARANERLHRELALTTRLGRPRTAGTRLTAWPAWAPM
jgi:hypothetical protein